MKLKYCLPIIKSQTNQVIQMIVENEKSYDFFEIWLDLVEDFNLVFLEKLQKEYGNRLIFLFRRLNLETPKMPYDERIKIIKFLGKSDCLIDLDISQSKEIGHVTNNNLILSYHNYKETPSDQKLKEIIEKLTKQQAKIYKISCFCKNDEDALRLIELNYLFLDNGLKHIVLGMGKNGLITRLAAAFLQNELIYAPVSVNEKSAPGQIAKKDLEKILKNLKVCFFLADPIDHSLSPAMHNAAYKKLGLENKFLYLKKRVKKEDLKKEINKLRADPNFKGASISIPHKVEIMKYLDEIDPVACKIGAVNTIVKNGQKLKGYNTDWIGILKPLANFKNKKAAVIGAGGAARAAIYALLTLRSKIAVFNRDVKKGGNLAKEFNLEFDSLNNLSRVSDFDIVINATKVGMDTKDKPVIAQKFIKPKQVIFDVVYSKENPETNLIKQAKKQKAITISGIEMLKFQGLTQFKLFTGRKTIL